MAQIDESFTALPLNALADAALSRAKELGASHADVRVARIRSGQQVVRDGLLDSASDQTDRGISVRVVHNGRWGFAADVALTTDSAALLAEQAVAIAGVTAAMDAQPVELADEPVYPDGQWVSDYEIDPFTVPDSDRVGKLIEWSDALAAQTGVDHTLAYVHFVRENTFFANLAGSRLLQQRVRIFPLVEATSVGDAGFQTMRSTNPPTGRGWEAMTGAGWDIDAEIAQLGEHLAELVAAPSVDAGELDLVIAPSNLWLTIHESVAHGTELDRALGYEAAYAGTSFATFDQLGTLRYGSAGMNVTGDRVTPHGLSSVGWDDEGVAAQQFDIIRNGILVGYQLNRQMARQKGLGRSNGCAFADSPSHIPLQRMPNVSLQPAAEDTSTLDLIGDVSDGLYVVGDKSWSIDMQRYNFQFTGQRFHRIRNGRLAGQVKDAAYQATTPQFWGSMEAVGGRSTYELHGAINCGKGQPAQSAPVSHGCPAALFRRINVLNTAKEAM